MTTLTPYKSLHHKPAQVKFSIPLKAGESERLKKYFQAKAEPVLYFLHQEPFSKLFYFTNTQGKLVPIRHLPSVCAFVILEDEEGRLELILGEGNHSWVSRGAQESYAAGDTYFDTHKISEMPPETVYFKIEEIVERITDQSGGYHVSLADPLLQEKRFSARAAMEACGLPVQKLEHFLEPDLMSLCDPATQQAMHKISEIFQTNESVSSSDSIPAQRTLIFSEGPNKEAGINVAEKMRPESSPSTHPALLAKIKPNSNAAPAA